MTAELLLWHARHVCREQMPTDHPAGIRSMDLQPGLLTLAQLDEALGERRACPLMPFQDRMYWYEVHVPGAPYSCSVFASTPDEVKVSNLMLRQDPTR